MRFSSRVGSTRLNAIAEAERAARAAGIGLETVNDSNPTHHGLAPAQVPGVYTAQPRGPLAAREALAEFLTGRARQETAEGRQGEDDGGAPADGPEHVDPERLYLLSSTSQAYSWLFKLMCDPGDIVLGPKPGYPLIESIGGLEGVETMEYQLRFDGSWFIDVPSVERLLDGERGEKVRAIVLINPNNPTGSYVHPGEREAMVELCRRRGIAIIADEVFFDYSLEPFAGNRRLAGERGALVFALDGFSKSLAAPHAKVGWIEVSGPDDLVAEAQRRLDVIADDYLPFSDIIAERMPELLGAVPGQLRRVRERTQSNLRTLHAVLAADETGVVSVLRAEGGWNVLLRFPSMIDENELVLRLIHDAHLTGQPGYFFDMAANGYLAVSLLPVPEVFARNVTAVLDAVAALMDPAS
ncbi:pyridoxal phosphate-dependent aminotransferase [Bifidobacterium sp. ESL0763]|uniref:pyridoxal phosphate-dependent aminotransferase n=1 Tax=Bifidobacterium sp. ESL0763 TaxID=2983227 RepID=UPI0023F6E172|nr:pyridoxal phosphate-dependent aminotransferase [Bifidobacterium sp. ESL0763]MDF7663701.1 pyridoxal phosphate-dependent aminotransferase [Bifidobacterium sp. ESL0763]